jgi:hypothetical protein
MRISCLAGVGGEDAPECVHDRVRIAGGASSGKIDCATEEEVDELRECQRGEIVCDGWVIAGEGAVWVTSRRGGNKIC